MNSRYDGDVLATDWRQPPRGRSRTLPAELGLVVEEAATGWCGAIVRVEKAGGMRVVHLEDRHGRVKGFPLGPGFLHEGLPVTLTPALAAAAPASVQRTASGSVAVTHSARVAQASRLFVEGTHDAELIEKIWGDDLRHEGVVVEVLEGLDHVANIVREFAPTAERRMGILADHLVPGTKEYTLAQQVQRAADPEAVRIVGHPYVDVWQSVRPQLLGWQAWPVIPRGQPWKQGILRALGWPHASQRDVAQGWKRILAQVSSYGDLEPSLLAVVEELIDFVTIGNHAR